MAYATCSQVNESGGSMCSEALARNLEITRHLNLAAIERLTDPANDLGSAPISREPEPCRTAGLIRLTSEGERHHLLSH
jgi:hypothetical protein